MRSLTSKVIDSLRWIFTNIAAKNGMTFLRTFVLWKLLDRRDFGLMTMAWSAIAAFDLLQDAGFGQELIRRKDDLDKAISVTWYANIAIRGVICAVLCCAAPWIALYYREPDLTPLVRVGSVAIVISAFGNVNETLLRKRFQFKRILAVEAVEVIVLTVTQVAFALLRFGAWSLVYGTIAQNIARAIMLWWLAPIRVGRFDPRVAKEMFHFGKHMTFFACGQYLIRNIDYILIGRYMGAAALGVYTLAFRLSEMISTNVIRSFGSVLYPALAEVAHDMDRLRGAWLRSVRFSMLIVTPLAIGLMLFSSEVIRVFYAGQEIAIIPLAVLVTFSYFRGVGSPAGDLAKVIKHPEFLTQAVLMHAAFMGAAIYFVVAYLNLGLEGGLIAVSAAVAAAPIIGVGANLVSTSRIVKFTPKQLLGAVLPSSAAGLVMAAGTLAAKWMTYEVFPAIPRIVVLIALGLFALVLYVIALLKMFPSTAQELRGILERRKKDEKKRDALPAVPSPT
jgi:O-antigen/teichoic acid export membrane protein